jgi:hypothetical protein
MADQRRHIWLLLGALLTFAALLSPAGAVAQDGDGVTVDPNSPSGHEYDIPTEGARREASGGKKSRDPREAPIFGEGVSTPTPTPTPVVTATATPARTPSAAARKRAKERRERARDKREAARRKKAAAAAAAPTPTPSPPGALTAAHVSNTDAAGFSSWALIGGMAITLVVAGTGGGLLLRRRLGPDNG